MELETNKYRILYLGNQVLIFQIVFCSWKLRSIHKFWIQNHFCEILRGQDIYETKCDSETDPKWLLVGLVTQTNWIDVITVFILIVFKICGSSELNNLSFDQNHLIENPILFCKYLSPLISHRNGFVFKICVWICFHEKKKQFEKPILGCGDIMQNPSLIRFGDTLYNSIILIYKDQITDQPPIFTIFICKRYENYTKNGGTWPYNPCLRAKFGPNLSHKTVLVSKSCHLFCWVHRVYGKQKGWLNRLVILARKLQK